MTPPVDTVSTVPGPVTRIETPGWLVSLKLRELWNYRELAFFFLWRDIKARYRQMAFGPLWMVVNPIINVVIYTILFGRLAKFPSDGLPYALFTYAALLPWTYFVACYGSAADSLLSYKDLISKVYFPRLLLPVIGILSSLVDILISLVMLIILMLYFGFTPTVAILWMPVFLFLAAVVGLALGLWAASWIVHFRDLSTVFGYVLRVWMYATPVVYATSLIPPEWQFVMRYNPMTHVVEGFRWSVLGQGSPPGPAALFVLLGALPVLISGAYYYRRTERSIVDIA